MTQIYLIRHCEAEGNTRGILQGRSDCDISGNSAVQLDLVSKRLREVPFSAFYSSPLKRAYKTAVAINRFHHLKIQTDPRLTEIDMGDWEGKSWEQIVQQDPAMVEAWDKKPGVFAAPNGESIRAVSARMCAAVGDIARANPGKTVCVTSHGCAIRSFLCRALGKPLEELNDIPWCDNTGISVIEFDSEWKPTIVVMNDASHIPPKLSVYRKDSGIESTNIIGSFAP